MIVMVLNILWLIYSILEGFREGFYWHFKNISRSKNNFEMHPIFASQRGLVLILLGFLLYVNIGWVSVINTIGMALIFSFFHNGSYYKTRNRLDENIYKKGWMDQSTTSTAKLTKIMTFRNRIIFMMVGILLQFCFLI